MKKKFLLTFSPFAIILLSSSVLLYAQPFQLKKYTTKDGLSSSYVWSIYEDKLGYLWLGTSDGLNRFDGKNFISYGVNDGLPDVRTAAGFMDSHFRFWVDTRRGVAELKAGKFVTYPFSDSSKIRWSVTTETKKGQLWNMTNAGVYEFRNKKWWKLLLYPGYENVLCSQILETKEGMYLNYGDVLVLKRPDNSWKIVGPHREPRYYYLDIRESAGEIFVSTIEGMYILKNGNLVKAKGELGNLKGIYTFLIDSKKRFWVGNESAGLRLMLPDSTTFQQVYKHPAVNLISQVTEDKQGNIWVADFDGLIKITEANYKIFSSPEILDTPALRNIIQPPSGPIFLNNGTLTIQEYKNGKFIRRKLHVRHSALPDNELIIDKYTFDDKNRHWYYLRGFALAMQKGNSVYEQSKELATVSDQAFDVLWDSYRKKILIAVRKQNLPAQYDEGSYSLLPVKNTIKVNGNIMRLHQCLDQTILFATDTGAVYSINKQNICKLQLAEFNLTGSVAWFCNDPSGDVWIAYSGRGLRRYYWNNGQLIFKEELSKATGFPSSVSALCFDNFGNLWVSSLGSIIVLSKKNEGHYGIAASYEASDLGIEYPGASLLTRDNSGNIWMSTLQSIVCFYPQKLMSSKTHAPTTLIENVKLNFKQTDWSQYADSLYGIFQLPGHLKLSHDQNNLSIYFRGVSSSGTAGVEYSYKLTPLYSSWSSSTQENFVSFSNLPDGKYLFQARARLSSTEWSDPVSFNFEIRKPFWEAWWFRLLIVVTAAALIVFIFRYRLHQLKEKNKMQKQMHELKIKAFKLQMNPHFVHNALNSIQSLVLNNNNNQASIYINKFAKLLRQILENSDQGLISLDKELYSLQLYVDLEKLRMNLDIGYTVVADESIEGSEIKIPPLILQPFVENALWHGLSRKEGNKKILLNITTKPGWIICEITDNGIGRKKAAEFYETFPEGHLSKAIHIIRQRLADFNQSPNIEPISFIDLEENSEPKGTTVIVKIKASST